METLQQMLAVMAVLGLLVAVLYWLRRRGLAAVAFLPQRRQTGRLQTVERLPLSATHTLHLVRAGDRAILLASFPSGCQLVESAPWSHYEDREARS